MSSTPSLANAYATVIQLFFGKANYAPTELKRKADVSYSPDISPYSGLKGWLITMNFKLEEAMEILEMTPKTLEQLLTGLSDGWLHSNEGEGTWTAFQVVNHLIECEKTNWIPRLETMLQEDKNVPFPPFDRFSHLKESTATPIEEKLQEFTTLRAQNIMKLKKLELEKHLERTGSHPAFGVVKVSELLSTWAVHDLTHLAQIVRVLAKRYSNDVGPWQEYLGILK